SRDLSGHLPEAVKEERWHRFMATQAEISAARAAAQIGTTQDVIIDGPSDEPGEYLARSKADAPEIDGVVYLKSSDPVSPGDIVRAKVTGADAYDLYGEVV
ncbi:MAG: TRAM domain-containing protein, partial [Pseudomonadota bacterium]